MYNNLGGNNNMLGNMFGTKGNKVGTQVDALAINARTKIDSAINTLKTSDMIEMQFANLSQMAKASGDMNLAMQFDMLKSMIDQMQNNAVMMLNEAKQDLMRIDQATDLIQY